MSPSQFIPLPPPAARRASLERQIQKAQLIHSANLLSQDEAAEEARSLNASIVKSQEAVHQRQKENGRLEATIQQMLAEGVRLAEICGNAEHAQACKVEQLHSDLRKADGLEDRSKTIGTYAVL